MLLAIDVGNSQTVCGIFKNSSLVCHWRLKTDREKTADELAARFLSLFTMQNIQFKDISGVIIASVVPTQQQAWQEFSSKYTGCTPLLVNGPEMISEITIATDNPSEVGADRIVNAVAAYHKYKTSLIVIDFGTATTFDAISKKGEYVGGAISPGIMIASEALFRQASKLPRVEIFVPPERVIGKDTASGIKSGIIYGYAGLVDGMVKRMKNEMGTDPRVIATGGLAKLMQHVSDVIEVVEPNLTLDGLRIISNNL